MKFKVGNRVFHDKYGGGTIVGIGIGSLPYLIEFDDEHDDLGNGNNFNVYVGFNYTKPNRGYRCDDDHIVLIKDDITQDDLQDGDILTYRNGYYQTYSDTIMLHELNDALLDINGNTDNDVIKVERPNRCTIIYERRDAETIEYTINELEKKLGHKIKIKGDD